jgi:hypothetical protein
MKQIITQNRITSALVFIALLFMSTKSFSQQCAGSQVTATIENVVATCTSLEWDLVLKNTGTTSLKFSNVQAGWTYPVGMFGTTSNSAIGITILQQPSACAFPGYPNISAVVHQSPTRQFRFAASPAGITSSNAISMPAGVAMKYARFKVSFPFASVASGSLTFNYGLGVSYSNTAVGTYCNGNSLNSVQNSSVAGSMIVGPPAQFNTNCSGTMNCITGIAAFNVVNPVCLGGTGSASINVISNAATISATYSLDGGSAISFSGNNISLSGLSQGYHAIVVTDASAGCAPVSTSFVIAGPTSNTINQSIASVGSYFWAISNVTYTSSGIYTHTAINSQGCPIIYILNLIINPLPTTGTGKISVSMANMVATCNSTEWDIMLENQSATATKFGTLAFSCVYPLGMLPTNAQVTVIHQPNNVANGCAFGTHGNISMTHTSSTRQIRTMGTTTHLSNPSNWVTMPTGVAMKYARIRVTYPNAYFANGTLSLVSLNPMVPAYTNTAALVRLNGNATSVNLSPTSSSNFGTLVVGSPLVISLTCGPFIAPISTDENGTPSKMGLVSEATSIYPNPTNNQVFIEFFSKERANSTVKVFDMTGRLVKQIQAKTVEGFNKMEINLSECTAGIYSVQLLQADSLRKIERIRKD